MPVKWTAEKDQILLFKIIDTHCPKIDVSKIHEAWTDADGEKPTQRALTEHIATLRKKAGGVSAKSPSKPVLTPTKPVSAKKGGTKRGPYGEPETFRKRAKNEKYDSDVDMDMSDFGGLSAENIIKHESPGRAAKSKIKNYAQLAGLETDDEAAADTGSDFAQADGADGVD